MEYLKSALFLPIIAATTLSTAAQTSNDNAAVWYNARHGDSSAMNQVGVWYYTGNKVAKDYNQAFEWWRQASLKQNPKSIANLGVCYQYGRGVEADSIEALRLYLTAIRMGQQELLKQRMNNVTKNTFDAILVGKCYAGGIGVDQDMRRAADLFASVANKGSVEAMIAAADAYLVVGEPREAVKYYEKAAATGDVYSLYMSGKMRLGNMGVSADRAQAVDNIIAAAKAGNAEAQGALGVLYLSGDGVDADKREAEHWLKEGAIGGDAASMWQYGQLLKNEGDYDQALHWMALAANAGQKTQFEKFLNGLSRNDSFYKYVEGIRYYNKGDMNRALEAFGDVNAKLTDDGRIMEAIVLADERYPKNNPAKAIKTLEKLSQDNPHAAYALANIYMEGKGVPRDTSKAINLYRQASKAGYGPAEDVLATIYYEGVHTTIDRDSAKRLYRDAKRQRHLSETGASRLRLMGNKDVDRYQYQDIVRTALSED